MSLIERLKAARWEGTGARLVVLHGSALRRENPRDLDVVAYTDKDVEEVMLNIMEVVENAAGLPADVYVFDNFQDLNCTLLLMAARDGVILYSDEAGRWAFVKAVGICNDYLLMREKVRYTETLVERVWRRVAR
ncbi:MAG: hypothetical protein ABWJ97_03230 [Thermoproteus sp.]